jgi:hypothetical protein
MAYAKARFATAKNLASKWDGLMERSLGVADHRLSAGGCGCFLKRPGRILDERASGSGASR